MRIPRLLAALLTIATLPALAQTDLAVTSITAPQSSCALTTTENVTIHIFNYGSTLPAATSFTASYTINAGAPVTEPITLAGNFTSNTSINYTFTTQANLSTPGTYTFDATVSIAGDVSPTNNAYSGYQVISSAASVGGSVGGTAGPTLSGTLTLSGHTGSVISWQQSDDGGLRWRRLANTTTTQAFDQLREHTGFRVLVHSGVCAPALSSTHLVMSSDPIFYSGVEP
jgi:hypothetical protein